MIIQRRKQLTANVGVLSVGHATYWAQFEGLLEEMHRKTTHFIGKLKNHQVTILNFGLVDNAASAYESLPKINAANLDVLFVDMVTYATSSTFAAIARDVTCPIVLVALQPMKAMKYEVGTTFMQLCNDDICSIPEFTGVAIRMGKPVSDVIIGSEEDDPASEESIAAWCRIAHARHDIRTARIGQMGHVLEAMLDMHTDAAALTRTFGSHVVQCEADEVMAEYSAVREEEVMAMAKRIVTFFDTPNPISDPITEKLTEEDLQIAAQVGVALERFIERKHLDGLAYYYEAQEGSEMRNVVTNFIVGNSLLTAAGFPMCGECDIKTCVAMFLMDRMEMGGSFAEFHPVDFTRDTVLVGHDGPHHVNIADQKPVIRSLKKYHGKPGKGVGVEFNIKNGPVTILSIGVQYDGSFKFILAEGESLPGPIPPTGNTNTHCRFSPDVRTFLRRWCSEGPTHHFALGIGHHAKTIAKLAETWGISSMIVTPENSYL